MTFFSKVLTHGFGPKMAICWTFCLSYVDQENVIYDILEWKNAFLRYKNKKFNKSKNWHFSHGVNPWFWSKNGHFSNFFFLGYLGQENVFCDILERKNAFLRYKKKKSRKLKNWHFSKGVNSLFWSKNGHFSNFFFLSNLDQDNVFYDILERKNAFLRYKKQEVQKVEKWPFFQLFFLGNLDQENVFCDILERKNAFVRYKNKKLHCFGRKMAIFAIFFFCSQFRPGKSLLRYSRTKKRLSSL